MGPAAVEQGREGVSSGDVVLRRQVEGQTEVTSSLHHQLEGDHRHMLEDMQGRGVSEEEVRQLKIQLEEARRDAGDLAQTLSQANTSLLKRNRVIEEKDQQVADLQAALKATKLRAIDQQVELEKNLENARSDVASLRQDVVEAKEQTGLTQKRLDAVEKAHASLLEEMVGQKRNHADEIEDMRIAVEDASRKQVSERAMREQVKGEMERSMQSELELVAGTLEQQLQVNRIKDQEIGHLKCVLKEIEAKYQASAVQDAKKIKSLTDDLDDRESRLEAWERERWTAQEEQQRMEMDIAQLQDRITQKDAHMLCLKERLAKAQHELREIISAEVRRLQSSLECAGLHVEELECELHRLSARSVLLERTMTERQAEMLRARKKDEQRETEMQGLKQQLCCAKADKRAVAEELLLSIEREGAVQQQYRDSERAIECMRLAVGALGVQLRGDLDVLSDALNKNSVEFEELCTLQQNGEDAVLRMAKVHAEELEELEATHADAIKREREQHAGAIESKNLMLADQARKFEDTRLRDLQALQVKHAKECSAAEDSHAMALELLFKEQNSLEQVLKTKEKLEDDLLATVVKLEDDLILLNKDLTLELQTLKDKEERFRRHVTGDSVLLQHDLASMTEIVQNLETGLEQSAVDLQAIKSRHATEQRECESKHLSALGALRIEVAEEVQTNMRKECDLVTSALQEVMVKKAWLEGELEKQVQIVTEKDRDLDDLKVSMTKACLEAREKAMLVQEAKAVICKMMRELDDVKLAADQQAEDILSSARKADLQAAAAAAQIESLQIEAAEAKALADDSKRKESEALHQVESELQRAVEDCANKERRIETIKRNRAEIAAQLQMQGQRFLRELSEILSTTATLEAAFEECAAYCKVLENDLKAVTCKAMADSQRKNSMLIESGLAMNDVVVDLDQMIGRLQTMLIAGLNQKQIDESGKRENEDLIRGLQSSLDGANYRLLVLQEQHAASLQGANERLMKLQVKYERTAEELEKSTALNKSDVRLMSAVVDELSATASQASLTLTSFMEHSASRLKSLQTTAQQCHSLSNSRQQREEMIVSDDEDVGSVQVGSCLLSGVVVSLLRRTVLAGEWFREPATLRQIQLRSAFLSLQRSNKAPEKEAIEVKQVDLSVKTELEAEVQQLRQIMTQKEARVEQLQMELAKVRQDLDASEKEQQTMQRSLDDSVAALKEQQEAMRKMQSVLKLQQSDSQQKSLMMSKTEEKFDATESELKELRVQMQELTKAYQTEKEASSMREKELNEQNTLIISQTLKLKCKEEELVRTASSLAAAEAGLEEALDAVRREASLAAAASELADTRQRALEGSRASISERIAALTARNQELAEMKHSFTQLKEEHRVTQEALATAQEQTAQVTQLNSSNVAKIEELDIQCARAEDALAIQNEAMLLMADELTCSQDYGLKLAHLQRRHEITIAELEVQHQSSLEQVRALQEVLAQQRQCVEKLESLVTNALDSDFKDREGREVQSRVILQELTFAVSEVGNLQKELAREQKACATRLSEKEEVLCAFRNLTSEPDSTRDLQRKLIVANLDKDEAIKARDVARGAADAAKALATTAEDALQLVVAELVSKKEAAVPEDCNTRAREAELALQALDALQVESENTKEVLQIYVEENHGLGIRIRELEAAQEVLQTELLSAAHHGPRREESECGERALPQDSEQEPEKESEKEGRCPSDQGEERTLEDTAETSDTAPGETQTPFGLGFRGLFRDMFSSPAQNGRVEVPPATSTSGDAQEGPDAAAAGGKRSQSNQDRPAPGSGSGSKGPPRTGRKVGQDKKEEPPSYRQLLRQLRAKHEPPPSAPKLDERQGKEK